MSIVLSRDTLDADGNVIAHEPRWDRIFRKQSDFVRDTFTVFDPVLWQSVDLSGAGLAIAIQAAVLEWAANDEGAQWENGRVVLDDGLG